MKTKPKFQILCESISEKTGIGVMFFDDPNNPAPCEDDGNLHVTRRGLRACFNVGAGQSNTGKEQNERAKTVLKELGMEKFICDNVLVDETEEDDDYCPHCGHGGHE